jgi:hypothetical protein
MINVICILFIGVMAGIVPTLAIGEWLYHKRLKALERHWDAVFQNSQKEWTAFYEAEIKRWKEQTAILIDEAADEASKATDDLWRGRKLKVVKKEEPKN